MQLSFKAVHRFSFYGEKISELHRRFGDLSRKKAADAYALELIGDAYSIVGKKRLGQQSYKKAFALSPENTRLKGKIEQYSS